MTHSANDAAAPSPLPSPEELRRLRKAKSLSEEQVATATGVTVATVRSWETGRATPRGRRREAYEKLIGSDDTGGADGVDRADGADGTNALGHSAAARTQATGSTTVAPTDPGATRDQPATPVASAPTVLSVPAGPGPSPAEAFDALYVRLATALFRQTYLLTGRRNLSKESVERAFEQAWQRWPEVAVDRDPAGWVRAAAYEYAMSPWHRLRRAHRRPDPQPATDPRSRALLDALLDLPPAYRRTLLLHDGVGLDLPDTAAETEASTPAAAGRLMTARAAVAERVPELAIPLSPDEESALLHEQLGMVALAQPVAPLLTPHAVRTGSENRARLWTQAAIALAALLVGLAAFTIVTAPPGYETPPSPAERVGGVPPRGGPQKLTPQDQKMQKKLDEELVHGPARLVPEVR
ncbi:helix-turn-helix domain-containing protein [Streptomyces sp. NPDC005181]|uniref:helix-turn-helix domain-containing protein n=1 Tax=Streptomyces sp. NPDC005181 TaxID=3156869 RepID=UPI0033B281DB